MNLASYCSNKCRACLSENPSQLFCWTAILETTTYEPITFLECFQKCTRLEAYADDQLPQSLCFKCAAELRDAFEFIKKATLSHQTLLMKQEPLFSKTDEEGLSESAGFEWVAVRKTDADEIRNTDAIADTNVKEPLFIKNDEDGQAASFEWVAVQKTDDEKSTLGGVTDVTIKTSSFELSTLAVELTKNVEAVFVKECHSASIDKLDGNSISLEKDGSDHSYDIDEKCVKNGTKRLRKQQRSNQKSCDLDCSLSSTEEDESDSSYVPVEEPIHCIKSYKKKLEKQPKSNELKSKMIESEMFLCHLCPRIFKAVKSLKDHELTHEENRERNYTCELCGKAFLSKVACKKHSKTHDVNRLKPFKCQQCDKSFLHHCSLKTHMLTHSGDTLECKICKKVLLTQNSYRNHYKKHDINRKATFQCDQCEKSFFYKRSLDQHMPIHTNGLFRCNQCDKSFFHKYSLDTHQLMHTGETVPCEICGKRFPRSSDLKGHMRTHSKDTPFKCQYCDKAFSRIGVLNKHELEHEGYLYTCKICSKEYTNQASLFKHKLTHTGITMKCLICGKGFNEKFKMKRHIAGVHKIEIEKTEELIQKVKTKREFRGLVIDET